MLRPPTMKLSYHQMEEARNAVSAIGITPREPDEEFLVGRTSCAEELRELNKLNEQVGEILDRHLTERERLVFNCIVDSETGKEIDLDKLEEAVPASVSEDTLSIVASLWEKGVLSIKIFV